ncbi:MAG: DUF488 family protein [Chloroflexaceae bacterium]
MHDLYTIGYAGHSIVSFIDTLHQYGIEQVIDVRQLPHSRKPGFSKARLERELTAANILYTHMIELGTPKTVRDALKRTGDYDDFFAKMRLYIAEQHSALQTALDFVPGRRCALLCLEANHAECHRSVVAVELQRRANFALNIEHI